VKSRKIFNKNGCHFGLPVAVTVLAGTGITGIEKLNLYSFI